MPENYPPPAYPDPDQHIFDLKVYLENQRTWSLETFGPGTREKGVLDHLAKELEEVRADPVNLSEWVDVMILAFDGALRQGYSPNAIADTLASKHKINRSRTWPDWRTMSEDEAIEHDRTKD